MVRFNHEECGDTRQRLYVRRTLKGWLYHCHNCAPHMSGFQKNSTVMTPSETVNVLKEMRKQSTGMLQLVSNDLPDDFTTDIPDTFRLWLDKYQITDDEVEFYGFGYSPRRDRLVMPVYNHAGLIGWQGRGSNPKYLTCIGDGQSNLWFDTRYGSDTTKDYLDKSAVVLVEDIISAIKVGRYRRSIALLGSYVREDLIIWMQKVSKLRKGDMTWYIWLDPDKRKESYKIAKRLRDLGMDCEVITTDGDPKDELDETLLQAFS